MTLRKILELNKFSNEEIMRLEDIAAKAQENFEARPSNGKLIDRGSISPSSMGVSLLVAECRVCQDAVNVIKELNRKNLDQELTMSQEYLFQKIGARRVSATRLLEAK